MKRFLAIDIGASSGRAIVGTCGKTLELDEISRFTIEVSSGKQKRLNLGKLKSDIVESIKKATNKYNDIKSIGIDTWAVDFVCLDRHGNVVVDPMFYRDQSFVDALEKYQRENDLKDLYEQTGIQIQPFNSYFQFQKLKENYSKYEIETCLLLPDYLNYYLTGIKNTEFTNLTTTQTIDVSKNTFNIKEAKYFPETLDSRHLGKIKSEFALPYDIEVISVASHDTASAHVAIPNVGENTAFLSSGTWSLLGVEVQEPITSDAAYNHNFSNEGCYNKNYRFQKNIMGLWMIVNLAKEEGISDFAKLSKEARKADCNTIINVNDERFFNPQSMRAAIVEYIDDNGLEQPKTVADFARIIYRSLAVEYAQTLEQIATILNREIRELIIVGGGAKAEFMNEEIARHSNCIIKVFPYECSALGNIIVQALEQKEFTNISEAHQYIDAQLETKVLGEER